MDLTIIQSGAREYHIRSLFKEDTWKKFFRRFPEISEVSFLGNHGTWKETMPGVERGDLLEMYLKVGNPFLKESKDEDWVEVIEKIFTFLLKHRTEPIRIEVKLETNYLDDFSGWVKREDLVSPTHFWHNRGIQGFSSRVRILNGDE